MINSEISEIKKRFKKEINSFSKVMGCYVNGQTKEIICKFNKDFQGLDEEDMFKFLDIASRILSGRLGNNLLEFGFSIEAEEAGIQKELYELNRGGIKKEEKVEELYSKIIGTYFADYNYMILLFKDDYDVPKKGTDRLAIDESEEVFSYMICAICPVELSKPGLGYLGDKEDIGSVAQEWMVRAPETGFMFPVFNDRTTDIHNVLFYTKNALEPHTEFVEDFLGCSMVKTEAEKKEIFEDIIKTGLAGEKDETIKNAVIDIEYNLYEYLQCNSEDGVVEETPMTKDIVSDILDEKGYDKEALSSIKEAMNSFIDENEVTANNLVTSSSTKIGALRSEQKSLVKKIAELEGYTDDAGAIIKVKDKKRIETRIIDGVECLVIPTAESEIKGTP